MADFTSGSPVTYQFEIPPFTKKNYIEEIQKQIAFINLPLEEYSNFRYITQMEIDDDYEGEPEDSEMCFYTLAEAIAHINKLKKQSEGLSLSFFIKLIMPTGKTTFIYDFILQQAESQLVR